MSLCAISDLKLPKNGVLATEMEFGERKTSGGILRICDDAKEEGIRARWCRVLKIGKNVTNIEENDFILVSHGRWTHGMDMDNESGETVITRFIDHKDILMKTKTPPQEYILSNKK